RPSNSTATTTASTATPNATSGAASRRKSRTVRASSFMPPFQQISADPGRARQTELRGVGPVGPGLSGADSPVVRHMVCYLAKCWSERLQRGVNMMNRVACVVTALALGALVGCNQSPPGGNPPAAGGQRSTSFKVSAPATSVSLKQGDTEEVKLK